MKTVKVIEDALDYAKKHNHGADEIGMLQDLLVVALQEQKRQMEVMEQVAVLLRSLYE